MRMKMNNSCPKCGTIPATSKMFCQYLEANDEPYENGKRDTFKNGERELPVEVHFSAQYCEKCEAFIHIEVSEAPMIND